MKLPRFYLSTLLLACVFVGAVIGLYIRSGPWQREYFLLYGDDPIADNDETFFSFNFAKTRLVAWRNQQLYLFDLASRKLLQQSSCPITKEWVTDIAYQSNDAVIQLSLRDKENILHDYGRFCNVNGEELKGIEWENLLQVVYNCNNDGALESRWWTDYSDRLECVWVTGDGNHLMFRNQEYRDNLYEVHYLDVGLEAFTIRYSYDSQFLAVGHSNGISVWRRTPLGWRGYIELPLFWIALVSFLCLLAVFVRRLARSIWKRA